MADTVNIKWVYPPNFDGFYPDKKSGNRRITVKLTGYSDGTGETNVIKVNKSELQTPSGNIPSKLVVERIDYSVHGLTVTVKWDYSPDQIIYYINAGVTAGSISDSICFLRQGSMVPDTDDGTGDILITTENADAGDTYDITLCLRLKD